METVTPQPNAANYFPLVSRLQPAPKAPSNSASSFAWKWTIGLLAIGLAWRFLRYALQFPIWGDEAFVCVNLLDRDYLGLLKPLDYKQVAPILFLWSELTAFRLLGGSELAIRLLPFLAGLGSLFLFWRLARATLDSAAALIAVGIFAVSYYAIRHGCEVKPYAFDLFWALVLLVPAVNWLGRPDRWGWLALLAALVPIALGASYPAVFVAGAVSVILLPAVWRNRTLQNWTWFAIYNVGMGLSFLLFYRMAGAVQFDSTGGMANWYWSEWFPPTEPLTLIKWLGTVHTGAMMAYPAGGSGGASIGTSILCLLGIWEFCRIRRWSTLLLCLAPFGLTFVAAALHRYPYGGSARVAQHLVPAICLLAGNGAAALICWTARAEVVRGRFLTGVSLALALIAVVGMDRDWRKPYKTLADAQLRDIVQGISRQAKPGDQIVVMDSPDEAASQFVWYLGLLKDRPAWHGNIDWDRLAYSSPTGQLWCLYLTRDISRRDSIMTTLSACPRPLALAGHEECFLQFGQSYETREHCEVFHWKCLPMDAGQK